jgi:hypothetical protein
MDTSLTARCRDTDPPVPARGAMTTRHTGREQYAPAADTTAVSDADPDIGLVWHTDGSSEEALSRRSRRRSAIAATITSLTFVLLLAIDTPWSYMLALGMLLGVGYWDTKVRNDPSDVPVLIYFAGIAIGGIVLLATLAVFAGLLMLMLE